MDRVHAQQARRFLDRVVGFDSRPCCGRKLPEGFPLAVKVSQ